MHSCILTLKAPSHLPLRPLARWPRAKLSALDNGRGCSAPPSSLHLRLAPWFFLQEVLAFLVLLLVLGPCLAKGEESICVGLAGRWALGQSQDP